VDDGREWTLDEFLADLDLSDRTLRYWQQLGLVPEPVHAQGRVVYTREHEYRVLAIFRLQGRGMRRLADIATMLDAMTRDELKRLVEGAAEADLAVTAEVPMVAGASSSTVAVAAPSGGGTPASVEEHVDVTLRPGLVLRVQRPIDDETRALVASIAALAGRTVVLP
jgi:DNA-binding transcriptional MerR regulator